MKKTVIIIRANPVSPDTRVERTVKMLSDDYNIKILAWDKSKLFKKNEISKDFIIHRNQGRRLKIKFVMRLFNFTSWIFFIYKNLLTEKYDAVHACDFDTYFFALIPAKIRKKKIIYDIFDFYAEMLYKKSRVIIQIIKKTDIFLMKFADLVIMADDSRYDQIFGEKLKNLITVYNSPPDLLKQFQNNYNSRKKNFTISYLGLIDNEKRDLNFIIDTIKDISDVQLNIYGSGKDFYLIKTKCEKIENVFVFESVPYYEALKVGFESNIILSVYNPKIKNNIYASPNKVFESMMLKKPIIINEEVMPAKIIKKYKCGVLYTYGSKNSFKNAVLNIKDNKSKEEKMSLISRNLYETVYSFDKNKDVLLSAYKKLL